MMQRPINIELKWLWREAGCDQTRSSIPEFHEEIEGKHEKPPVTLAGLGFVF